MELYNLLFASQGYFDLGLKPINIQAIPVGASLRQSLTSHQ
ncbi:MAG: hypothetical protein ACRC78_16135 [Planktothrix sp.]